MEVKKYRFGFLTQIQNEFSFLQPKPLHLTTCILHPTTCTLHPAPYTLHPTPYTLHPTLYTLHPKPYTLHSTPYTLHPAPGTLRPTPCTLHPTHYTLHPSPNTLNHALRSAPCYSTKPPHLKIPHSDQCPMRPQHAALQEVQHPNTLQLK